MRIVEKAVHSPGEGLDSPVHVLEGRDFGKVSAVLGFEMLFVGGMFGLSVVDPGYADGHCGRNMSYRIRYLEGIL